MTILSDAYITEAEMRARRFSGAYTGTAGSLAADVIRLIAERKQLLAIIQSEGEGRTGEARCQSCACRGTSGA